MMIGGAFFPRWRDLPATLHSRDSRMLRSANNPSAQPIPRDPLPDSTLALALDPYRFISRRCRRFGTDLFETRLLLQKTICMTGRNAAELLYDQRHFLRHGAPPARLQKTLFGTGGVQSLDGQAHRHRKRMFMSIVEPQRVTRLGELADEQWRACAHRWTQSPAAASPQPITLFDEARQVLCRAVCDWAGIPLPPQDVARRTRQLTALFQNVGSIGPMYWYGRGERIHLNRWASELIDSVRAGTLRPPSESALHVIANHRDLNDRPLDTHVAAVELLNVIRPTVAVAVFITFAAHALHEHADFRREIAADDDRDGLDARLESFAQEVRRFYPFFPAVVALVRDDFEWNGYRFARGRRAMLDLYGTNHDPRIWTSPERFDPDRFRDRRQPGPYDFIPQGGGDAREQHRCPGEGITVELMKRAARFLLREIDYAVPAEQNLRIDFRRLPALPHSGFVISNVRFKR